MDKNFKIKIDKLYVQYKEHDSRQSNRLDKWRNLEPESALLLYILIKSKQAKQILEIGTSNGYSTLWIAETLKSSQGHLITIEIEENRTIIALNQLKQFGLDKNVKCLTIDAAIFLSKSEPIFDLILLDAEREAYVSYWNDLRRLIINCNHCTLVVDNVLSHKEEVKDFISLIEKDENFISTTINVGAGLLLVTKS